MYGGPTLLCGGDGEDAGSSFAEVTGVSPVPPGRFYLIHSRGPHAFYVDLFPFPTNCSKPLSISSMAHPAPTACERQMKGAGASENFGRIKSFEPQQCGANITVMDVQVGFPRPFSCWVSRKGSRLPSSCERSPGFFWGRPSLPRPTVVGEAGEDLDHESGSVPPSITQGD